MGEVSLKEYVERIKDLEVAVFTQQKLVSSYTKYRNQTAPTKPAKKDFSKPSEPSRGYIFRPEGSISSKTFFWLGIVAIIASIVLFIVPIGHTFDTDAEITLLGIVISLLLVGGIASLVRYHLVAHEEDMDKKRSQEYEESVKKYKQELELYNKKISDAQKLYDTQIEEYNNSKKIFDNMTQIELSRQNKSLNSLENALDEMYSMNIIFPKYRNLVAISAIYEYLASGRCSQLEGRDGAYNIYEMELRQNIVIGQLSTIINNLEMVKENQFTLYQEITKANATVDGLLKEMKEAKTYSMMTAYCSNITALAETSPKITVGYII